MPQVTNEITRSRRLALKLSVTATAAAVFSPVLPAKAMQSGQSDAKLVALCKKLVANGKAHSALFSIPGLTEMEELAREPEVIRLGDEEEALVRSISALCPPRSMAGMAALAKATMAIADREPNGALSLVGQDPPTVLALLLSEAMADGEVVQ